MHLPIEWHCKDSWKAAEERSCEFTLITKFSLSALFIRETLTLIIWQWSNQASKKVLTFRAFFDIPIARNVSLIGGLRYLFKRVTFQQSLLFPKRYQHFWILSSHPIYSLSHCYLFIITIRMIHIVMSVDDISIIAESHRSVERRDRFGNVRSSASRRNQPQSK